jgi:outer membrane protein assembly complex protein YaeT
LGLLTERRSANLRSRISSEAFILTFRPGRTPRRGGLAAAAVALVALAAAAPALGDIADFIGLPVAWVRLVVDGRETTEPALSQLVVVRLGQPFAVRDVRETVLHLYASGRFEDVRVDARREGTGVAVRFELTAARPVTAIAFAGDLNQPGIDEGRLRRAIVDRAGPTPPVARAPELERIIDAALRTQGYLRPKVSGAPVVNAAANRTILVFTVDPGPRAAIGTIDVSGPESARAEFLSQAQLVTGAPFVRDAIVARVDKYVASRRSHGYYEAKVAWADLPIEDDRTVNLTFTVDPGRHVRVVFTGDSFPGAKHDLVPVEREGSVDEDLLEDSTARIEDALKSEGYKDARAPHERAEQGGELVITFNVTRGQQYRIAQVSIGGNTSVPIEDLQSVLRLREGQPFSQAALDSEAASIEDVYRRSGFAAAKADIEVKPQPSTSGPVPVNVTITVREGVRTIVGTLKVTGNTSIPESRLLDELRLQPGRPFVLASLAADRDTIILRYLNAGYENATVDPRPELNRDRTRADIVFAVREGPRILIDHVIVVGPHRTSASIVEKEIQLKPGDPLSRDAVLDSQRRLQSLGLYRSVVISELRQGEENRRDLLVTVEEGPATSLAYGGGFELARRVEPSDTTNIAQEEFDAAPRGSFQITRRNLFGTNRSASLFASLTLHPLGTKQQGFTEYNVVGTFREPRIFDTLIDGLITLTVQQQFRSSFDFRSQGITAEGTRKLSRTLSGTYQLQNTNVYNENVSPSDQSAIDRVFPKVLLSSFSLSALRDTRNDPIDPTTGEYLSGFGQLAARALGGQVGFVKSFFRASVYRPVSQSKRVVLAGNAFLGLATGFPQQGILDPNTGQPDLSLPQSERFYAGGDTTNRGFAIDQLGVRHIPSQPEDTIDVNGFPLGGNAVVLFNAEVRVPTWRGVEVHTFLDTGNVFQNATNIDFSQFRPAVGLGALYKSPIGPLRFDLGFKLHPQLGESPTAFFITFGQAF